MSPSQNAARTKLLSSRWAGGEVCVILFAGEAKGHTLRSKALLGLDRPTKRVEKCIYAFDS
jgi:hypothetical protein